MSETWERDGFKQRVPQFREQLIRGLLSETPVHYETDVPISFAYVCADHSDSLWTFRTLASARPRQKKTEEPESGGFETMQNPVI